MLDILRYFQEDDRAQSQLANCQTPSVSSDETRALHVHLYADITGLCGDGDDVIVDITDKHDDAHVKYGNNGTEEMKTSPDEANPELIENGATLVADEAQTGDDYTVADMSFADPMHSDSATADGIVYNLDEKYQSQNSSIDDVISHAERNSSSEEMRIYCPINELVLDASNEDGEECETNSASDDISDIDEDQLVVFNGIFSLRNFVTVPLIPLIR